MDTILVRGGKRLEGSVTASGSKNATLPLMAAALLTDEPLVLRRVPHLRDIATLAEILGQLGVEVARDGDTLTLRVVTEEPDTAPYDLVATMRASICVLGPLLAKRGRARVSMPGGCVFGVRPIDLHEKGLNLLGAGLKINGGYLEGRPGRLRGAEVYLGSSFGSSVTGTANVLMGASLAEGRTVIENAALEPEVADLARCLNAMGARISGIDSHRLVIDGVERLHGTEHTVIPDRIEVGTYLVAGAITAGDVTVCEAERSHLLAVIERLEMAGAKVSASGRDIRVIGPARPEAVDVTTLPFPGFPTDLQAQFMALASVARGISVITERIYPDRFMHLPELARLGARVRKEGPQAIVQGTETLSGAPIMASDLRASAALVLAGLVAQGETLVRRVYHIDRGYERIDEKLRALGADIERGQE
ncbi:MAG: UDP-N-acetylglucosamine 1-carboxyvinyltransferase [Planctomycetes bacterium]|nr:UDP-N-acetylglucosamine 1-carboxyvinyltransferase [Planctomycetota bacterium]